MVAPAAAAGDEARLAPPPGERPLVVQASFALHDVDAIDDSAETVEFAGVLTLRWKDPRQAFDPAAAGVDEKVFQGAYQFNELATGWYPQLVLVNETGATQRDGVVLRIAPDGSSTLSETIAATIETPFDVSRMPFDSHRLRAIFEVFGFDSDTVVLRLDEQRPPVQLDERVRIPKWTVTGGSAEVVERAAPHAGARGLASDFVLVLNVARQPFHVLRLVIIPLILIVLLSFVVFWMDRSTLGDRISVSFIGILTGVSYQMLVADELPSVSYGTFIHGFLGISFLATCATVVINIVVSACDKRGQGTRGDLIDRRCRWIFPLGYFSLLGLLALVSAA